MKRLLCIGLLLTVAAPAAYAKVLYDGTTLPDGQGWTTFFTGGTQTLDPAGFVAVNTTGNALYQGGFGQQDALLNSATGFTLQFSSQVLQEAHSAANNRSGFSLIVTDQNAVGIEIGFWQDTVWAQNLGFTQGEMIAFDTTTMTDYALTIVGDHYSLTAGDGAKAKTLSGSTRAYGAQPGSPAIYDTAAALFFGDDTTSAAARFNLKSVSVIAVPEPSSAIILGGALLTMLFTAVVRKRQS
ncbi:MAG: PEP-CTERM sorting domain-containing protein [Betaproteobacteria bacterium]